MEKSTLCACGCICHRMRGIFTIAFGLTFLLGAFEVLSQHVVSVVWPIIVILAGAKEAMPRGVCKCCNGSGMLDAK